MSRFLFRSLLAGFFAALPFARGAAGYLDNAALEGVLQKLQSDYPALVRFEKAAQTGPSNAVWRVEAGLGSAAERRSRPALLVVAGAEGTDLAGTSVALSWLEGLVRTNAQMTATNKLLETTTIYLFPRLNPDAAAAYFNNPVAEQSVNARPADEDHDGLTDEDGPEDVNGDGLVTSMRIKDPEGDYIEDPLEPRLLLKTDKARGETGVWRVLTEGRDNDKDNEWNEDAAGGVNLNRNFPFGYKFFAPDAGLHPVSEPETRALADFIVNHHNIAAVFTFGAADNLIQTPKSEAGGKRPPTLIQDSDIAFYRELGKLHRNALGLKKELSGSTEPGTFSDWMYFHRGRLSLAARTWNPAVDVELAKDKKKDSEKPKDENKAAPTPDESKPDEKPAVKPEEKKDKPAEDDKRNEQERAFLKWADAHATNRFVPWKSFEHPDFPGKTVEIGGLAPFAQTNPPESLLPALSEKHGAFLTQLAGKLPRLHVRKTEIRHLGKSVYDLVLHIENSGYLPTSLAQGMTAQEVRPVRVVLRVPESAVLSGERITRFDVIPGSGGSREARAILHLPHARNLDFEVISDCAGIIQSSVALPE